MDYLILAGALALSVALAFGICGTLLACLLSLITRGELPFVFHWRRVLVASALFWFWYLAPVIAEIRVGRFLGQP